MATDSQVGTVHLSCDHVITFVYAQMPHAGETLWYARCQAYHDVTAINSRRAGGQSAKNTTHPARNRG